ncbi:MAG: HAMP domain-containing histidine kinase [Chloroflexi bacterium]|nr:MAG: HAMP domain-containing histidine kinase [Chloroflexota bacterium]
MSLRLRLTLLYTSILGGVLLVFGILVYTLITVTLLDSIDSRLSTASQQLIDRLRVTSADQFDPRSVASYQPTENLLFQVWDMEGNLQLTRPVGLLNALDENGLGVGQAFYSSKTVSGDRIRVLSVPLKTSRGPVGVLQVGLSLALVDVVQRTLIGILVLLTIILMLLVGLSTWFLTRQALAPLATVTEVATRITQADDLSRRIPASKAGGDEVGKLILAFNDTLERLENLFNTQRRFTADVSHELRTPLTVIKGEVGLMRLTGSVDEESIGNIEREVDRLTRLVGDLLLLSQAESGRLMLDMAEVDLDTVLLEVYQQARTLAGDKVTVSLSEIDQVHIIGDRDRLKQVLLNLAANAIQYSPAGKSVTLGLQRADEQVKLFVQDTGPGISPKDLPHIFDRFFRAERSRKRSSSSGFGLGLSIADWIVKKHNGRIEVSSEEGQGTLFTVWLPLTQPEAKK